MEVSPALLRLKSRFVAFTNGKGLESSHDGPPDSNDPAPLNPGSIDLCGGPVTDLKILGPHLVVLDILVADVPNREDLRRPEMQRDTSNFNSLGLDLSE
jgi:hypothetical protein